MFKGLYVDRPEHVVLKGYAEPRLGAGQVRVRTEFAAIKHGTMFHIFSGESPFHDRRFDPELRLFVPHEDTGRPGGFVGQFIGNMAVGTVLETGVGVAGLQPGDRVYGYAPVCERLTVAETDVHPLRAPMTEVDAVCLDPALYAYAAIRDGRVGLGDSVVVFGLGAIGLFVVQMLALSGCLHVLAVDPIAKRRTLAEGFGAELTLDPESCDVGLEIRNHLGHGADVAIEASGHYDALREALRAVRNCARVVTLGYYRGGEVDLRLSAEWHHNRLELIGSMPVWDNPSREHPLWDLQRLTATVEDMFLRGWLASEPIVDPIVELSDAPQAFMELYRDPSDAVKLGVRFPS